jgi:hypothetical protein
VADGTARGRGLLLDGARMTVAGAGTIALATGAIDLILTPKPKAAGLVNLATSVRLVGTLARPHVSTDAASLAKALPRELIASALDPPALLRRFASAGMKKGNPCAAALAEEPPASKPRRAPGVVERGRGVLRDLGRRLDNVLPGGN